MQRKAMTTAITLIVTLVVVLAVGLIIYMISSGILTDFGLSSKTHVDDSFDKITCKPACIECCSTSIGNTYYEYNAADSTCNPKDDCGTCTCP